MGLSDQIYKRRRELGLTLKQIADRVGVSEATVQRWESGEIKNVRHPRIEKLADTLRINPSELMGWGNRGSQINSENSNEWLQIAKDFEDSGLTIEDTRHLLNVLRKIANR